MNIFLKYAIKEAAKEVDYRLLKKGDPEKFERCSVDVPEFSIPRLIIVILLFAGLICYWSIMNN